ncbi:MAG: Phosphoribosylformylglycinamidine cyclo-ligase [Verrucomicrobia subdivision 3 bacterium]|nr:Phosphoribosylformylglycinamidine cyclo-ligase [Limisphaerales bacterium]MCS1416655.1 Phosphoribosylformylglycinamidine cyclo-ligase [Limisphaerales bacterium]
MKPKAYAKAGVDIDLGNQLKTSLPSLLKSTHRPEVLITVGGFGGLFELNLGRYRRPVLVSSVDGVGTKLKAAFAAKRHNTIGEDLVNHCVNDIAVFGAEPLFFLDYLGTGILQPKVFEHIIAGFAKGCRENHCALIGGETAQMPGFYQKDEYDVSGTIVGIIERSAILDGKTIKPGDVIIGFPSNGLHTNGYTLARQVFFEKLNLRPSSRVKELGSTVADELLRVHRSYLSPIQRLIKRFNRPRTPKQIKAFAHITGGGFTNNIPRILPPKISVRISKSSWEVPPVFELIRSAGKVSEKEMYTVFNMGIGLIAVVSAKSANSILAYLKRQKEPCSVIGEAVAGNGECSVA